VLIFEGGEMNMDFDNSRLQTYEECPELYNKLYNLGLAQPMAQSAIFSEHLVHLPLTDWYMNKMVHSYQPDWQKCLDNYDKAMAEQKAITGEDPPVDKHGKYTLATAQRAYATYIDLYGPGDRLRFRCLDVEKYIVDPEISFGSKPDVLLQEIATSTPWTAELKFSSWAFILMGSAMNPQVLGQVNNTGGEGCLFTLIQPKDTKWSEFICMREEIVPRVKDLELWKKEQMFRIETVKRSYATGVWPRRVPKGCGRYNGECFFLSACEAGNPPEMLARLPKNKNPLAYLGKDTEE
jgi:hypothetical protein